MEAARKRVLICRFPGEGFERQECVDWLIATAVGFKDSPDVEILPPHRIKDTPVDMSRNRACKIALDLGVDYLVMVDADIEPDYLRGSDPEARPFLSTSLDFMKGIAEPCIVAAPYCGAPPEEFVFVFEWVCQGSVSRPDFRSRIEMIGRNEASRMIGFSQVPAIATGLMIIDTRVLRKMPHPWFYYESKDPEWTQKASTEDVTFSRDAALLNIPVYCNWQSWCRHWKSVGIGKPMRASVDIVHPRIAEMVAAAWGRGDRIANATYMTMFPGDLPKDRAGLPIFADDNGATSSKSPLVHVW